MDQSVSPRRCDNCDGPECIAWDFLAWDCCRITGATHCVERAEILEALEAMATVNAQEKKTVRALPTSRGAVEMERLTAERRATASTKQNVDKDKAQADSDGGTEGSSEDESTAFKPESNLSRKYTGYSVR